MLNRFGLFDIDALLENSPTYHALKDVKPQGETTAGDVEKQRNSAADKVSGIPGIQSTVAKAGRRAAEELNRRAHETGLTAGEHIAAGSYGSVHEAHHSDHPNSVVKFDTGPNEARLAQHMIDNRDTFKDIRSLPRYHSVHKTSFSSGDQPIMAIHREDLKDLPERHQNKWDTFGSYMGNIHYHAKEAHEDDKKWLKPTDTGFDPHANLHKHIIRRTKIALDTVYNSHFKGKGAEHEAHFHRVRKDVEKMVGHGIIPCDMGGGNWGIRKKTGEVVMRDVGCYEIHNPKQRAA